MCLLTSYQIPPKAFIFTVLLQPFIQSLDVQKMDTQQKSLFIKLELVWWLLTAILIIGILYPIYTKVGADYPFYPSNLLFIITFITFTRLIFLLKYSFLANWEKIKIGLILFTPIFLFYLVNELNYFQTFLDEKGVENFLAQMSIPERESMRKYITAEMLLFGVGSLIAAVILPVRLLISIWRIRNRGTI